MTRRRLIFAVIVAGIIGSSSSAAFAGVGTDPATKRVCVMVNDDPATHAWDGICAWVPVN